MLDRAPSAVFSTAWPLVTLVLTCWSTAMSAFMLVLMARLAASSAAEVIREPLEILARALLSAAEFLFRYCSAVFAAMLVPMTGMSFALRRVVIRPKSS